MKTETICDVCGKTGKEAKQCEFQHACSCWRGIPCKGKGKVTP